MEKYIEAEMSCVAFAAEDIISTSSFGPNQPGGDNYVTIPTIDPDEGAIV